MLRRLLRWILYSLGAFCLLTLLAVFLLWWFFPAERVRQYVVTALETRLQRPIHIGALHLRGLGFAVSDIHIADPDPQAPVPLSVDRVQVRVSLRHLLAKRLVIERIVVSRPHLALVEHQGIWNLQTLLTALATPSVPPTPGPRQTPQDTSVPSLPPLGLELTEFLVQDVDVQVRRDTGLDFHLQGLSIRLSGEISQHANHLTAHLVTNPDTPNLTLHIESAPSLQVQSRLHLDLRLMQQRFRTASLTGRVRFVTSDLRLGTRSLSVDLRGSTDMTGDMQTQTVEVQRLHLQLGDDTVFKLQGQVAQVTSTPTLALKLDGSSLNLADVQGLLAAMLPAVTLQGMLTLPRFAVQGSPTNTGKAPVRLTGDLELQGLTVHAPSVGLHFTGLDGTLTDFQGLLAARQPREVRGAMTLRLHQAKVAGLTLASLHNTMTFALHGTQLSAGSLTLEFQAQKIRYQHPTLGPLTTVLHGTLSADGNFHQGSFSSLHLKAHLGQWLDTSIHGTAQHFGSAGLDLTQEATLHLDALRASLPQPVLHLLSETETSGTLRLHNHFQGQLPTSQHGSLTLQSRLEINSPRLRYGPLGIVQKLRGRLRLQTAYAFPKGLETLRLHGSLAIQHAQVMDRLALPDSTLTLHLRLPERSASQPDFRPELELALRSSSLQLPQFTTALHELSGTLRVQTQLAADHLGSLSIPQAIRLWRMPHLQGTLRWATGQMQAMAVDQGSLDLTAQADTMELQSAQTDIRLQVGNLRYGPDQEHLPATPISLHVRASQERDRGHMTIEHLELNAPNLLRINARGETSGWGETVQLDLSIPACHLKPLLARLSKPYRGSLPFSAAQGQITMRLTGQGQLPSLDALRAFNLPQFDLQVRLHNLDITRMQPHLRAQGATGTLRLSSHGDTITLLGDIGLQHLDWPGMAAKPPQAAELTLEYVLRQGRELDIRKYELRLPQQGLTLTMQGGISYPPGVLFRQSLLKPVKLLKSLSAQLTTSQSLSTPVSLQTLWPDLRLQGALQNALRLTLHSDEAVRAEGRLQLTNLSATYAPLMQLTGLEGVLQYQKTLTLNRPSTATRTPLDAHSPPATSAQVMPRALRGQLRAYSPRRDSLVAKRLTVGPIVLSAIALDVAFKNQLLDIEHFQANLLDGALAGSIQLGQLTGQRQGPGVYLAGEFAQVNLARLLPEQAGITPGEGDINGNLEVQLAFPPMRTEPVGLNALTATVNITHIGKQALDRLLLFLDPLGKHPTIVNQRRLLRLATPRLLTLRLHNGLLHLNTELDTPLGRKRQPVSPIPISALEEAGFPQVSTLLDRLEQLRGLLWPITARGLQVDAYGHISAY
jgi:uncharacterized protein involved in outer membrane biogenesis